MSKYTMYYNEKQQQYRDFATNWMKAAESLKLSDRQRLGMALFFKPIARRFGLTQDFKDIGVI